MSLNQYILNPALKSNAVLNASTRELIKKSYESKFDNIMLRENGKITYYLFTEKEKTIYWAYIKVPSEVVHKFYYDVLFRFTPNPEYGYTDDLFKYNVQFFSNDPNFCFTFAYVFNKNDLLIPELKSRIGKEFLTKAPEVKNPTEQLSYEKAIYFAYLVMRDRKLNRILRFRSESKPLEPKFLLQNIVPAEEMIQRRQEEGQKYSKKKKAVISKDAAAAITKVAGRNVDLSTSHVKVAATTKKVGTIKRANSSKFIKTTPKK